MKYTSLLLPCCLSFILSGCVGVTSVAKVTSAPEAASSDEVSQMKDRWVVILGAYKTFPEAKSDAESFVKASKVPFSMNGMVYDNKGLHYPKDMDDELYAGQYVARRFNSARVGGKDLEEHISIEKSDDYNGFAKGYYIVVGSIAESAAEGEQQLKRFKPVAAKAYVKKTSIYLGCMH